MSVSRAGVTLSNVSVTANAAGSVRCARATTPTSTVEAGRGGGVSIAGQQSSVSFVAGTVVGNAVGGSGGGVAISGGSVAMANVVVAGNTADMSGGGVMVGGGSSVAAFGASVHGNSAGVSGGGVSCSQSSLSVAGSTVFDGNTVVPLGEAGGAAIVTTEAGSAHIVVFDATTTWLGNRAPSGGALAVHARVGNATCDADAEPCARAGLATRGAHSGVVVASPLPAFVGNVATRQPRSSSLAWWNSPPSGPLAAANSSVVIGQGVRLRFALGHAAPVNVSSRASWNAVIELVDVYGTTVFPEPGLRVVLSVVANNQAASVTGAVSTDFVGATAAVIGAVLIAIPQSTVTVHFSLSPESGIRPLVHTMQVHPCEPGFAPTGDRCTPCRPGEFSQDGLSCELCPPGMFSEAPQAAACTPCPIGRYLASTGGTSPTSCTACFGGATTAAPGAVSDTQCECLAGMYLLEPGVCTVCDPAVITCKSLGTTLATVRLVAGVWRVSNSSARFWSCPLPSMCVGSSSTTPFDTSPGGVCGPGGTGPFCAVCRPGWHMQAGGWCAACHSSSAASLALQVSVAVVALLVVGAAVWWFRRRLARMHGQARLEVLRESGQVMLNRELEAAAAKRAYVLAKQRSGAVGEKIGSLTSKAKIALSYLQVVSLFPLSFDLQYPKVFMELLSKFDVFNVDVFRVLSVECATPWVNHYTRLLFWTLCPVVLGLALWLVRAVAKAAVARHIRADGTPGMASVLVSGAFPAFLVAMFTVFPSVCNAIFQTFACVELDDNTAWMQADLSLSCRLPEYTIFSVYAGVMAVAYCIGVPAWYLRLLWPHRAKLSQGDHEGLDELSFLFDNYRPNVWWFEVFEMGRKILLTGVAVLILRGTMSQLTVGLLVAVLSMLVYAVWSPFDERATNHFALASQLGLIMTLLAGVLVRSRAALSDGYDEEMVGVMIVVLNLTVPLIGVGVVVYKHCILRWIATRDQGPCWARVKVFVGMPRAATKADQVELTRLRVRPNPLTAARAKSDAKRRKASLAISWQ